MERLAFNTIVNIAQTIHNRKEDWKRLDGDIHSFQLNKNLL